MIMEIKEYGIVLLLDDATTMQALEYNQQIAVKVRNLENVANIWHVTLYHGAFRTQDLEEIYRQLQALEVEPLNIKCTSIFRSGMGYIHWNIEKNPELQALHESVVKLANPFHRRPLQMSLDFYNNLPTEHQMQINSYGVNGLFDLYTPHMTLFYKPVSESQFDAILPDIANPTWRNGTAVNLVIGELGYGNIAKILYHLPINNLTSIKRLGVF